jgi:hypothetical protein
MNLLRFYSRYSRAQLRLRRSALGQMRAARLPLQRLYFSAVDSRAPTGLFSALFGKSKRMLYNLPWTRRLGDKVTCLTSLLG